MIAGIAAVLLGFYAVAIVVALMSPGSDPQRGVAIGVLLFVLLFLAALGGLLWVGWRFEKRWIVNTVFAICCLPAFSAVGGGVYWLIQRYRGY